MEDDPREVDWAPRQIRALRTAVNELQSAVASMRSHQDFMSGGIHGEPFEVWSRRQIGKFGINLRDVIERLDGLDNANARKGDGISGLSDQVNSLTETTNRLQELFTRVSALEGYPRRITPGLPRMSEPDDGPSFRDNPYDSMKGGVSDADEFMVPPEVKTQATVCDEHKAQYFYSGYDAGKRDASIGETSEQIAERRRVLVESMRNRRITFDPEPVNTESAPPAGWVRQEDGCWSSPVTVVLNQVEARVRDYMGRQAPWTTEGVVRAVQGEFEPDGVEHPPIPGAETTCSEKGHDHSTSSCLGPVKTSECPANTNRGSGAYSCWAWGRQHYHDKVGVVHITDAG